MRPADCDVSGAQAVPSDELGNPEVRTTRPALSVAKHPLLSVPRRLRDLPLRVRPGRLNVGSVRRRPSALHPAQGCPDRRGRASFQPDPVRGTRPTVCRRVATGPHPHRGPPKGARSLLELRKGAGCWCGVAGVHGRGTGEECVQAGVARLVDPNGTAGGRGTAVEFLAVRARARHSAAGGPLDHAGDKQRRQRGPSEHDLGDGLTPGDQPAVNAEAGVELLSRRVSSWCLSSCSAKRRSDHSRVSSP